MNAADIVMVLQERGLLVDSGNRMDGPFIPDGWVRIYKPETYAVLGDGYDLEAAYEALLSRNP